MDNAWFQTIYENSSDKYISLLHLDTTKKVAFITDGVSFIMQKLYRDSVTTSLPISLRKPEKSDVLEKTICSEKLLSETFFNAGRLKRLIAGFPDDANIKLELFSMWEGQGTLLAISESNNARDGKAAFLASMTKSVGKEFEKLAYNTLFAEAENENEQR